MLKIAEQKCPWLSYQPLFALNQQLAGLLLLLRRLFVQLLDVHLLKRRIELRQGQFASG